jgi:hypothetical protein
MIGSSAPSLLVDEAIGEIGRRPGLIPVDVDPAAGRLVWMDIGDTSLTESYFFRSSQQFLEQTAEAFRFSTSIDVLDEASIVTDACYPSGFIYHMGRSGSTLLSKALSRVPGNLVISEAPPHFFVWPLLLNEWRSPKEGDRAALRRFRHLTLAMGRSRTRGYGAHFVKFTTYVVLFARFISSAFPEVPSLFLYRHPAEVLVAMAREGPGWRRLKDSDFGAFAAGCTVDEVKALSELAFYERCLFRFMRAALEANSQGMTLINYRLLVPDNLTLILSALNHQVEPKELAQMQEQFAYYSKDDTGQRRFVPDSTEKQAGITPEIALLVQRRLIPLYHELEGAENNLSRFRP